MRNLGRWLGRWGLIVALVMGLAPVPVSRAAVEDYGVSISPSTIAPGADATLLVRVTNISGSPIKWIQVGRPNGDYVITSINASGWTISASDDGAILTGRSIAPDGRANIQVAVHAAAWQSPAADWTVLVSTDPSGADPTDCTGSHTTSIALDTSSGNEGVGISGVTADPHATSVAINWHTDQPTGTVVDYGPTNSYGSSTAYDGSLLTDHQVTISGLESQTGYHFRVGGLDINGTAYFSGDNTFLTLDAEQTDGSGDGVPNAGGGGAVASGGGGGVAPAGGVKLTPRGTIAIKATPTEAVAPVVAVTTSLARPFTATPVIAGTVSDNVAVARVDYSLDGGKTWILIPGPSGLGTKLVRFTIAPSKLEDGNYSLMVRGIDTSGNTGRSVAGTVVVDLQPPRIGTELVAYGAQAAVVDEQGRYRAAVGADQTVSVNAVGGPTSIVLMATRQGATKGVQTFYLRPDRESGLWSGVLGFVNPGTYSLRAVARDGAGNQTARDLREVVVSSPARVTDQAGKAVGGAQVTVYQRNADTGNWTVWDAEAYGQVNPLHTRVGGVFGALVPAGTYYLEVKADGYRRAITQTFAVTRVTPLAPIVKLATAQRLVIGKWSWTVPGLTLTRSSVDPAAGAVTAAAAGDGVIGKTLPRFALPSTSGRTVTSVGLQGHPTVVTMLSTWSPVASAQLAALAGVPARAKAAAVVPVYTGEHMGRAQAVLATGGYDLTAVVDEQAVLGDGFGVPTVPTHYFVDQTGKVKAVYIGVLSTDELLKRLAEL